MQVSGKISQTPKKSDLLIFPVVNLNLNYNWGDMKGNTKLGTKFRFLIWGATFRLCRITFSKYLV